MTKITWKQTEPYEWTGTDEKENYVLIVVQSHKNKSRWFWHVNRDEDEITSSSYEEIELATTADEAKARAEKALQIYLNEQNNFTNTLREVLQVEKPTQLENEIEREMFYHQKP